ncbi:DUF1667 domain-containing protein [Hathewaya massiliensis]|uniref:DUF1667 domain-containing protein n=1 Tax=Hathewaya massiliensis TaxID=1964382 RepID=UPI00115B38E6|nr:DUF1667 domain-containing protein [Hathewaya massiliensis]
MKDISLENIIPKDYLKDIEEDPIDLYKENEKNYAMDIFTTVIRAKGSKDFNVVSVKTDKPIHKDLWIEVSKALSRLRVGPPLKIGDVVCKNVLNTGVDIICTRNLERK